MKHTFQTPEHSYEFVAYAGAEKQTAAGIADINAYYQVRSRGYNRKWSDPYYDNYPNSHDTRHNTIFVVLKENGEVIGGQRIVFRDGQLPVESHHKIVEKQKVDRFASLRGKDYLSLSDIVPAVAKDDKLVVAELGAFVINKPLEGEENRNERVARREAMYEASLAAAKEAGVDISLMAANTTNRKQHLDWLAREKKYPYRILKETKTLFSNPMTREDEATEILLINLSNRYSLKDAEGILRFNQEAAQAARAATGRF